MKRYLLIILFTFFSFNLFSQSLGVERLAHAKKSIVRILIQGKPSGTGFVVSKAGQIITCWHVIDPAFILDSLNRRIGLRKIEAEFPDGETVELGIYNFLLQQGNREAVAYDYCFLQPLKTVSSSFEFLTLGTFEDINEGDQVYTIGYPLGIKQQFVSTGILSTKWVDTAKFWTNNKPDSLVRKVAWLDLTMNKGNSGGPIIKIGSTPSEDKVIGIATFILNPFANDSQVLSVLSSRLQVDMELGGISQVKVNKLFADAISNNSIGISGCISIDHIKSILK